MSKLLFFDIDGTLCMPGKEPSRRTVEAIRAARAKGHRVFISTGRNIPGVPSFIRAIGFDGYISNAGACAQVGEQVLLDQPLPRYLLDKTVDALRHLDCFYVLQGGDGNYADFTYQKRIQPLYAPAAVENLDLLIRLLEIQNIVRCQGGPIYKICFFTPDQERYERLRAYLEPYYDITLFDNILGHIPGVCGELNRKGIHKGDALRAICAHYDQGPEDAVAFGDSTNDLAMLQAAGLGIAVANGQPEVKAAADQVCPSCDEEGVAQALEALGLA